MEYLSKRVWRILLIGLLLSVLVVLMGSTAAHAQDDAADGPTVGERFEDKCGEAADLFGDWRDETGWDFWDNTISPVLTDAACTYWSHTPGGQLGGLALQATESWSDPVGKFAKAVMEGNTQAFRTVMTFWMTTPIPGLAPQTAMTGLRNITLGLTTAAMFASIVIAMTRLAIERRQAAAEGASETAKMLVRTTFSLSLLPTLVLIMHQAGDAFSAYALDNFVGGDLNESITAITAFDETTGLGPIFALACAGLAFLGAVAQLLALLIREAALAVIVAIIPIAAASSAVGTGRTSYKSVIGFTIGALLFKPVATLLYLFAFWAQGAAGADGVAAAVIGSILLALTGLSLPTLIRVVAPAAETIAAGGSQAAMIASAGGGLAAGAAASGAKLAESAGRSGGGGGSAGGSPAAGASPYGGQYSSGNPAATAGSGGPTSSPSSGGGSATAAPPGAGAIAGAGPAGASVGAVAGALRAVGAGAQAIGRAGAAAGAAADGAIGNYHGRIER